MGKKKQEFQIIEINRADDWCLPLWIGRQILQKMEVQLNENTEINEDPLDDDGTDGSKQQKKDLLDQDD